MYRAIFTDDQDKRRAKTYKSLKPLKRAIIRFLDLNSCGSVVVLDDCCTWYFDANALPEL